MPHQHAFNPIPWQPPTPLGQGKCTASETAAFANAFASGGALTSGSAACDGCIETDVNLGAHGPVVTALANGLATPIEINYGGCLADFDGMTGPNGCGSLVNGGNDCAIQECGDCSDFGNPTQGGPTQLCGMAVANGPCAPYVLSSQCQNEVASPTVEACLGSLQGLLDLWCGGSMDAGSEQ